jgi:hypothetical protein
MNAAIFPWILLLVALRCGAEPHDVVLRTDDLRLTVRASGVLKSLTAKSTGTELAAAEPLPIACVYRGGQMGVGSQEAYVEHQIPPYRGGQRFPATAVSLTGNRLSVQFAEAKVAATYRVTTNAHYLAFELLSLDGPPIDRIDLLQLRVKRLPFLGPWIDVAYDDEFGLCLCAGNIQTDAAMDPGPQNVDMRAVATREVALTGAAAVLFGCPQPKRRFLDWMEIVERDFHLPPGARNRRSPAVKFSYLWGSPTPGNVDEYIQVAKRAGFRMLLFSYAAFARGAGHFQFNSQYPRGIADLKDVTDRIRAAGLKAGLHLHYSKADRTDPYVTPVPDDRLHKVRRFTLAEPVDDQATVLRVRENPEGSTRDPDRRLLQAGQELIAYRDYTTQPPYEFLGCQRGALNTVARGRQAGAPVGLLDVDDWVRFIRFDQDTDIQDEVARRIAEIANATGPYDLVYFDGAEDVHDPFWFNVARAQERVYRLLQPTPPVCEAAMVSHFSWHMIAGGNAYDLNGQHLKSFCREISCRSAPVRALDFTRINFGWVFQFYPNLGPDDLEYILSRGAAWDCPFSLRLALPEIAANPRADDCLDVIKTWEDARIAGRLSPRQHDMLRTLDPAEYRYVKVWDAVFGKEWIDRWSQTDFKDQQHHLFVNQRGEYELVPIREAPGAADGRIKCFLFQRPREIQATYLLLWAKRGELDLTLPVRPERVSLMRPFGSPLPTEAGSAGCHVRIGPRCYVRLDGVEPGAAAEMIQAARAP